MEAKGLMINDLVWYVDEPIKVKHNYGKSIRYDDDSKFSHEVEQSYIKPIPLTEELLKMNGWIKDRGGVYPSTYCYSWADSKEVRVTIEEGEGFIFAYISTWYELTLHYVHELQHALRLCGLTDLADNFKIV